MKFELADPADNPSEGETVRVVGVFDTYDEDGNTYATLRQAKRE